MTTIHRKSFLVLVAVLAGWTFDLLFWKQRAGVSILVFTTLLIAGGLALAWLEKLSVSRWSLALIPPILFFASMLFVREEPLTVFVSGLLLATLLAGFALTLRSGVWMRYSLADWVVGSLRITAGALSGVVPLFSHKTKLMDGAGLAEPPVQDRRSRAAWLVVRSVLIGLLIALPVLIVMGGLLAGADPVFNDMLLRFFKNWLEYLWRFIYILGLAYLIAGVYVYSLMRSGSTRLIGLEKPWAPAFLGGVEASTVLACVDLLFALFVGVQFRYFFGGQANINLTGYTYASYARKGFMELVCVAFLSLLLFLSLSAVTRRNSRLQKRLFSGLGIGLVALVGVILLSAFYRLNLYESVYGFSRIRTYVHVFMIWLGLLLLAMILLELTRKMRGFGLALLLVSVGFGISLGALNVDGFIAKLNVARAEAGWKLDGQYLTNLSMDAVPGMVAKYQVLPDSSARERLGAALACKNWQLQNEEQNQDWRSYRYSLARARTALNTIQSVLEAYPVTGQGDYSVSVYVGSDRYYCRQNQIFD